MRKLRQRPGAPREEVIRAEMPSGTVREYHTPAEGLPGQSDEEWQSWIDTESVKKSGGGGGVDVFALMSLLCVIVGTLTLAAGAGLMWGIGAALAVGGGIVVAIGVLLGFAS